MDKITSSFLKDFSTSADLLPFTESRQFEILNDHLILHSMLDEPEDVTDVNLGTDEFGIDGLAIIVNGRLVFDPAEIEEVLTFNKFLDVDFVFTQSKTSEKLDTGEIAKFLLAVKDFVSTNPKSIKSTVLKERRSIFDSIYTKATKFRNNPRVHIHYCYAGKGTSLATEAAVTVESLMASISELDIFDSAQFFVQDRTAIQDAYKRMTASTSAEITLNKVFSLPEMAGVKESYLGLIPAKEILSLVRGPDGKIMKSVFYENIRDYDASSKINTKIAETISSGEGRLFALRNNGITILAPDLQKTGDKFVLSNYQIINGCQTSHVIESFTEAALEGVFVPIKIVITEDDKVVSSVIVASNQQNEVSAEQFWSLKTSQKEIEDYFLVYDENDRLYYERRRNQFTATSAERTRIVSPPTLARQFAAIFLQMPHIAGRYYREIVKQVESGDIFAENHKPICYFASAYTAYRIEWIFRNTDFDNKWKPFRYNLMHAVALLVAGPNVPNASSKKAEEYSRKLIETFQDVEKARNVIDKAATIFEKVINSKSGYNIGRDTARLQTFRDDVAAEISAEDTDKK